MRCNIWPCSPRWGIHLQPDLLSPLPHRPPQLSPPRSRPKPKPNSTDSCISMPVMVPVELASPDVAHETEHLNLLQHSRLSNFFFIFSLLCWGLSHVNELFPVSPPSQSFLMASGIPRKRPFVRRARFAWGRGGKG